MGRDTWGAVLSLNQCRAFISDSSMMNCCIGKIKDCPLNSTSIRPAHTTLSKPAIWEAKGSLCTYWTQLVLRSALLDVETKWCGTGALTNHERSELYNDGELYLVCDSPLKLINDYFLFFLWLSYKFHMNVLWKKSTSLNDGWPILCQQYIFCFIVLDSCIFSHYCYLIKTTQLQFDFILIGINWKHDCTDECTACITV